MNLFNRKTLDRHAHPVPIPPDHARGVSYAHKAVLDR